MRTRGKALLGVGSGLLALALIGAGALAVMNRPLSRAEVDRSIEAQLRAAVESDAGLSSALLTIYSADDDRLMQYAVGSERPGSPEPAGVDSRYHSASVGKTMLATVYGQLVDEGVVDFDDPAANWLDDGELAGLFTVDGSTTPPASPSGSCSPTPRASRTTSPARW